MKYIMNVKIGNMTKEQKYPNGLMELFIKKEELQLTDSQEKNMN